MTEQQELLEHVIAEDALSADIANLGGAHVVGKKVRPELELSDARKWVLNCLNPKHNQNFTQAQIAMIVSMARDRGSFHYIRFWPSSNNMTLPTPICPEDEKAKLQREYIGAVSKLEGLAKRLEKIQ